MNIDPQEFLNQSMRGALETKRSPVPPGGYPAIIKSLAYREVPTDAGLRSIVDVFFAIDDPGATEATGIPQPTVRKTLWLDLGPDNKLETGKNKNTDLGALRAALGQNDDDEDWNWNMLVGQACYVTVVHKGEYANIDKVGKTADVVL